jgi:mono/diheme cytochrome c family protein
MRTLFVYSLAISAGLFFTTNTVQADVKRGKELFEQRCSSCHGMTGMGDGPVAAAFPADQRPRNLSQAAFKFAITDAKMKELLQKGGSGVGLSVLMPPQPDLNDADIQSIIDFVHSLKK